MKKDHDEKRWLSLEIVQNIVQFMGRKQLQTLSREDFRCSFTALLLSRLMEVRQMATLVGRDKIDEIVDASSVSDMNKEESRRELYAYHNQLYDVNVAYDQKDDICEKIKIRFYGLVGTMGEGDEKKATKRKAMIYVHEFGVIKDEVPSAIGGVTASEAF